MKRGSTSIASNGAKKQRIELEENEELGKIESIRLNNFMCHENFEFQFGPRMNFIIGENGSGKSAILTGLILALGGKSKVTGRFSNIKGFVKIGKQKARIEVVLNNCGDSAYKPQLYGKKIRVNREFTVDGMNTYKLKSETDKVVSVNKNELNDVLNALGIHIDNPVQVLTQETSRTFLLSKHAKGNKLYEFFFKGTGLQALEDSYNEAMKAKTEATEDIDRKKLALPVQREELRKWKRFIESSAKIAKYQNELMWATVIQMEKIFQEKVNSCNKFENQIEVNKKEMQKCKDELELREKKLEEFTKRRSECSAILLASKNKIAKLKTDHENCNLDLQKHESSLDLCEREQRRIVNEIHCLQNRINETIQKTHIDVQEEKRKQQEEMESLQKENQKLRFELENIKKKRDSKRNETESLRQKMDSLTAEINSCEMNKKRISQKIHHLQMAVQDKVNVFGENTHQILKEINERRKEFKKLPKGPIGAYIEVKDTRWCRAVEKCISNTMLCSYCVDNYEDDRILKDIIKKYTNKMPSSIVCRFIDAVHDVSQHKAQSDFPTVLDMLNIKDVQVANALIDQVKIELKILIEDTQIGQEIMLYNPPRNCLSAYIMNCDQICLKPYRYYSETNPNRRSLLSSVPPNEIPELNKVLLQVMSESNKFKEQRNQVQGCLENIPKECKKFQSQIHELTMKMIDISGRLKDLHCVEETGDVLCLQEDLQALQKDDDRKREEIDRCQMEVTKFRKEKERIIEEKENVKKSIHSEKAKYDELVEKINQLNHEKETLSSGKKRFEEEVKACECKWQALKSELEEDKKDIEIATQDAKKTCPRINTERSREEIQVQLEETEKVVEEQSNCDIAELSIKYHEKLAKYKASEAELKLNESQLETLRQMVIRRIKKLKDIQSHTKSVIDLTFMNTLKGNGYAGSLKFDEEKRTLTLEVAPRAGRNSSQNHSTLSGGERSYVTIAFLLALWERTFMPFRVLDEYDVFMDSSNRQLSVNLIIKKAESMTETQFIFLSPQELPNISRTENVTIHKMVPPKRIDVQNDD